MHKIGIGIGAGFSNAGVAAPYALDNTVFAGAWSLHGLYIPSGSLYNGPIVKINRADNSELDIFAQETPDANGNRWLNSASLLNFAPTGLVRVRRLYDTSGNNAHGVPFSDATMMTIANNGAYLGYLQQPGAGTAGGGGYTSPIPPVAATTPYTLVMATPAYRLFTGANLGTWFRVGTAVNDRMWVGSAVNSTVMQHRVGAANGGYGLNARTTAGNVMAFTKDATANATGTAMRMNGVQGVAPPAAGIGAGIQTALHSAGFSAPSSLDFYGYAFFHNQILAQSRLDAIRLALNAAYGIAA